MSDKGLKLPAHWWKQQKGANVEPWCNVFTLNSMNPHFFSLCPPSLFFSFPPCVSDVITMMAITWIHFFSMRVTEAADGWCKCLSYHHLWLALSGSECWVHPNCFPWSLGAVCLCGFVFMYVCMLCVSQDLCVRLCVCMSKSLYALHMTNHTRASSGFRDCNSAKGYRLKLCPQSNCPAKVFLSKALRIFTQEILWLWFINICAYKQLNGGKGRPRSCISLCNNQMQPINNSIIRKNGYSFPPGFRGSVINPITRLLPLFSELHTYQRQHWREEKGFQLMFNQAV